MAVFSLTRSHTIVTPNGGLAMVPQRNMRSWWGCLGVVSCLLGLACFAPIAQAQTPGSGVGTSLQRSSLQVGSRGGDVAEIQAIFQLLGFYRGPVDGLFSNEMAQAVQRFQQAAGLPVTGQMGFQDWAQLLPSAADVRATIVNQPSPSTDPTAPNPTLASSLNAQAFPVPDAASQPPTGNGEPNTPDLSAEPAQFNGSQTNSPDPTEPEVPVSSESEPVVVDEDPQELQANGLALPFLKKGYRGLAVERLQERLQAMGFYDGSIDGIFGSNTENSVKAFQDSLGLESDGLVGAATWSALFNGQ